MQAVHLVYQSILYAFILGSFLLVYRYVYPKRTIPPVILVILISLLPVLSIFRNGTYESGDLSLHVMRTMSYFKVLTTELTIPHWTPEFNAGYGDPYFLFSYFLVYFCGSLIHLLGFSFLTSQKLILASSYILSGITMYFFLKETFNEKAGIVGAIFYLYTPYHLVDLHFRVTIAEVMSYIFLPLVLLYTQRSFKCPTIKNIVLGSISYALLILSHQAIAIAFVPISLLYGLIIWSHTDKNPKHAINYIVMLSLGLALSAFYWVPVVAESQYTQVSKNIGVTSFPTLLQLLYSPWRYGFLFQGHYGELSFLLGYTQLVIFALAIYYLIKRQFLSVEKRLVLFFLLLSLACIILMLPFSNSIWKVVPFLHFFQYPYRLLEIIVLCVSILAGIIATTKINKTILFIICVITVSYTILNWGNRTMLPNVNDAVLSHEFAAKPDVGAYLEPSSPIWADLYKSKLRIKPKTSAEVIYGQGRITTIARSALSRQYSIEAQTQLIIKENTLYFPGWTVKEGNKTLPIIYTMQNYPGIITFTLPKGTHTISINFIDTLDAKIGKLISLIALLVIGVLLIFRFYLEKLFFSYNTDIPRLKRKSNIEKTKLI